MCCRRSVCRHTTVSPDFFSNSNCFTQLKFVSLGLLAASGGHPGSPQHSAPQQQTSQSQLPQAPPRPQQQQQPPPQQAMRSGTPDSVSSLGSSASFHRTSTPAGYPSQSLSQQQPQQQQAPATGAGAPSATAPPSNQYPYGQPTPSTQG